MYLTFERCAKFSENPMPTENKLQSDFLKQVGGNIKVTPVDYRFQMRLCL